MNSNLLNIPSDAQVAILGVGSELRGDDAAGVKVVRNLKEKLDSPKLLLIDAGSVPENFTSKVRNFNPTHIILIDAVDFGEEPGKIAHVNPEDIVGQVTSTHRLPLSILMNYLRERTGAEVILIGIQSAQVKMGSEMTAQVEDGVRELVGFLTRKFGSL
ncbi:hypothetical protein AKJ48_01770 [candidate division MSBL1 archaeon SCGC-AAA261O19]|uniref:Hydrogenase 3 maturation protease n=2 Tax=candidate division MSBL1 TaxID=215777 RepID=A0A133V000_9EURY|nr:hypothetical protein AKJ42_02600 [candidate division MSBL1 archaeon SCGC-AAA261C02]KXB04663.1 hypothetical protein AKJ48_01770 [candidate division MSBL1 archaeon SCGC-AAA261O19]